MKNQSSAINQAHQLYQDHQLDLVAVVECNSLGRLNSEQYKIVFKIERHCKHNNIQSQFNFVSKQTQFKCEECGESIVVSNPPEKPEEAENVYDKF